MQQQISKCRSCVNKKPGLTWIVYQRIAGSLVKILTQLHNCIDCKCMSEYNIIAFFVVVNRMNQMTRSHSERLCKYLWINARSICDD